MPEIDMPLIPGEPILGRVFVDDNAVAVGVVAVSVLPKRIGRTHLWLINRGATTLTLSPRAGVTAGMGVTLPAGQLFRLSWSDDGPIIGMPWFAISSAAGGQILAVETYRLR